MDLTKSFFELAHVNTLPRTEQQTEFHKMGHEVLKQLQTLQKAELNAKYEACKHFLFAAVPTDELEGQVNTASQQLRKKLTDIENYFSTHHSIGDQEFEHRKEIISDLFDRFEETEVNTNKKRFELLDYQYHRNQGYVQHKINASVEFDELPLLKKLKTQPDTTSSTKKQRQADAILKEEFEKSFLAEFEEEEIKVMQRDSMILQHRMEQTGDKLKEVERQVEEISQAQQIIAMNVSQQRENLDKVFELATSARGNVKKGNVQLKSASSTGLGFRRFVVIFVTTLAVCLLFLDFMG